MRVGTEKSMNNTKKLRSALLSSLTIIASIVLGHTAQAASLYFEPLGTQLKDRDPEIIQGDFRYNVFDIAPPK